MSIFSFPDTVEFDLKRCMLTNRVPAQDIAYARRAVNNQTTVPIYAVLVEMFLKLPALEYLALSASTSTIYDGKSAGRTVINTAVATEWSDRQSGVVPFDGEQVDFDQFPDSDYVGEDTRLVSSALSGIFQDGRLEQAWEVILASSRSNRATIALRRSALSQFNGAQVIDLNQIRELAVLSK
jgi:hypothetical protein